MNAEAQRHRASNEVITNARNEKRKGSGWTDWKAGIVEIGSIPFSSEVIPHSSMFDRQKVSVLII